MYQTGLYQYFVCTESICTDIDIQSCVPKLAVPKKHVPKVYVLKATYPSTANLLKVSFDNR